MSLRSPSLTCTLLLGLMTGCNRTPEPIVIGHLAVLSGPDRERGLAAVHGVQLAVEDINADKGQWIANRPIAVLHADTKGDLDLYDRQAVRLATINHVQAIVGGLTWAESRRIASVGRDNNLIVMGASGSAGVPAVAEAFALGVSAEEKARVLDLHLVAAMAKRVVIIADGTEPGWSAAAEKLADLLRKHNEMTVDVKTYPAAWQLDELVKGLPDATVVFFGSIADVRRITDRVKNLIFAGDESGAEKLPDGIIYVAAYGPIETTERTEFIKRFTTKFGEAPTLDAERMYDATRTLLGGAHDAKSFQSKLLGDKLRTLKGVNRLMGPISFGSNQVARAPTFVMQCDKSGPKLIQRYEPAP